MDAIQSPQRVDQCSFCDVIANSDRKVYSDDRIVVILDIDPITRGHVLIVPRKHYLDLDDLPAALLAHLMSVAQRVVKALKQIWSPAGYSIMQNGGSFNDVGHFHLHVFPRSDAEEFNWIYPDTAEAIDSKPQQTLELLHRHFAQEHNDTPFPRLTTERLVLNAFSQRDAKRVTDLLSDPEVSRPTLNIPHPYQLRDAEKWLENSRLHYLRGDQYVFAIRTADIGELIGAVNLHLHHRHHRAALGYWIGKSYWNRGFATEAVNSVLQFGFSSLKLNKIYATHSLKNPASGRVLQKCGLHLEGELLEHVRNKNGYRSVAQYRMLRKEYDSLTPADQ